MTDRKVEKLLLSECGDAADENKEKMLSACGVKRENKGESRMVPVLSGVFAVALVAAVAIACIVPTLNSPVVTPTTETDSAKTTEDTLPEEKTETSDDVTQPADEKDVFGDVKFIDGRQTRKIEEREMTVSRLKYTVSAEYSGIADELYEKYGVKLYVSYDNPDNPLTIIVQDGKRAERCYSELLDGTPLCFVWADKTPLGSPALLYVCTEPWDIAEDETSDHTTEYLCRSTLFAYYPDTGTFAAEMPLGQYRRYFNNYGESEFYEIPLYNALLTDESQVRLDEQTGLLYLDLIDRSYDYGPEPQTLYMINYYDDTDGTRRINCHGLMSPLYFLLDINGKYNAVYPREMNDLSKANAYEHGVYQYRFRAKDYFTKYKNMRYDYGGDLRLLYNCEQVSELTLSLDTADTGKAFNNSTKIDTNGKISCEDMTALIKETLKKCPAGDYSFNLKFKLKNGIVMYYPVILRQVEPGENANTDFADEKIIVSSNGVEKAVSASSFEWVSVVKKNVSEYTELRYGSDFDITLPDGYELVEIKVGPSADATIVRGADMQSAKFGINTLSPRNYVVSVVIKKKIEGIDATVTFDFIIIKESATEEMPVEYLTVRSGEYEITVQGIVPPYEIDESLTNPMRVTLVYDGEPEYLYSPNLDFSFAYVLKDDTLGEFRSIEQLNEAIKEFDDGTLSVIVNTTHKSGGYNAVFHFSIEK